MKSNKSELENKLRPLWHQAQQGDEAAYARCLDLISRALRGYFYARLRSIEGEIEDLVQETMIAIHNKRETYDPQYPLSAWVFAIAKYKMIDLLRSRNRTSDWHDSLDHEDSPELVSASSGHEIKRDLSKLLDRLPAKQRDAIQLAKLEGYSLVEIADKTGDSVAALKVQIHRGIKKLSELVKRPL